MTMRFLLAALALFSCKPQAPACVPGEQVSCSCSTGQGTQTCRLDGLSFDVCSCGGAGGGGGGGDIGAAGGGGGLGDAGLPLCALRTGRHPGGFGGGDAYNGPLFELLDEGADASVYLGLQADNRPCTLPPGFSVTTSVTRSDGGSVSHQRSGLFPGGVWFTGTAVSLRLEDFDQLTFSAMFTPGPFVQTVTVNVALNRLGAPVVSRLPGVEARDCLDFFATDHGSVFCQQADGGKLFGDAGVVLRVPSALMAGSGDTIWTYEPPELVRYVDDAPAERTALAEAPSSFFPSADFAIVVQPDVAVRYVRDAGTLSPAQEWRFDAGAPGPWATAWDSTNLRLVRSQQECSSVGAAPGTLDCRPTPITSVFGQITDGIWSARQGLVLKTASGEFQGPFVPWGFTALQRFQWGELPKLCEPLNGFVHLGCMRTLGLARDARGDWQAAKLIAGDMIEADEKWLLTRGSNNDVLLYRLP